MKKLFVCLMIVGLIMFGAGNALAGTNNGSLGADVGAIGGGLMADHEHLPMNSGFAGGISGGGGVTGATSFGLIFNGTVGADVEVTGGGLAGSESTILWNPVSDADKSIGIKSESRAEAVTGGSVHVNIDPDGRFVIDAGGLVAGVMGGIAGQGTLDVSTLSESPIHFYDTTGNTGGIAGQGSVGGFVGSADAESLGDLVVTWDEYQHVSTTWKRGPPGDREYITLPVGETPEGYGWWPIRKNYGPVPVDHTLIDSNADAGVSAGISMFGNSYSASYRYVNGNTEGMGTEVGAFTTVNSYGDEYTNTDGLGFAHTNLEGGWVVVGGVATCTTQTANNGSGGAKASAVGFYAGAGELGDNFTGSAVGYSSTGVTTVSSMNGSISTSSAGMQVTTTGGGGQTQQGPM